MTEPLRLALIGFRGRMGTFTRSLLEGEPDIELCCTLERGDDLHKVLGEAEADVGLDFTVAGKGAANGLALIECGVRPVIGTSGVTHDEDSLLDLAAKAAGLAGLVVPNFCLGVWLQQEFARRAAQFLPSMEIVEEHHKDKQDAPSGTAVDTAFQMAGARGIPPETVPVHSVRLDGLFSNQTVLFGGPGEVLRLTHDTYGLQAFGPGILASLRYTAQAEPGVRRGVGLAFEWLRSQVL